MLDDNISIYTFATNKRQRDVETPAGAVCVRCPRVPAWCRGLGSRSAAAEPGP